MNANPKASISRIPPFWGLCVIALAIWITWAAAIRIAGWIGWLSTLEEAGQLGDLFGGVNALFTALAFAAVWWSGRMQMQELREQREELQNSRSVAKKQGFEATFFSMLRFLHEVKDDVSYRGGSNLLSGDAAFNALLKEFLHLREADGTDIATAYVKFNKRYRNSNLSPYFRTVFTIFRLIDDQIEDESERVTYGNLVRAQLSSSVLAMLAINGIAKDVSGDMHHFIVRYRLLKYLDEPSVRPFAESHYPEETFIER